MLALRQTLLRHARVAPTPLHSPTPSSLARAFVSSSHGSSKDTPTDRRPIVISGPSGSGKSTLINLLFKEYPETFGFSVSHTTRKPRPGEENGIAYHFVSNEAMKQLIAEKRFLEHAAFAGNLYGTSLAAVDHVINMHKKVCLLDIDLQGVRRVRESGLQARYIFVRPKSLTTLEERLRSRGTETEEALQKRLERARDEWVYGMDPKNFDHVVVNDDLNRAYTDLRDYIFAPQKSK